MIIKKLLFILFFLWVPIQFWAQDIRLKITDTGGVLIEEQSFRQLDDVYQILRKKQYEYQENGYLACSFDSIAIKDSVAKAVFFKGKQYRWAKLNFDKMPEAIRFHLNIVPYQWKDKVISPKQLTALHQQVLQYCENNGFPFATTFLDNFKENKEGLEADFILEMGSLQKIDTIIIEGNADISFAYIQNYLGIHQGDVYDESRLRQISKRLSRLPFLKESKAWKMDFTIDKNKLFLFLDKQKANQIDGVLGLQPRTESTGKFLLTADFLMDLKNSLGYGEGIAVTYKNLEAQSPKFQAIVSAPYVLGTMFGIEGSFDLYKKDSSYRKLTSEVGLKYQLNSEDYIRLFYQNTNNRLITPDTHFILSLQQLPPNIDMNGHGFGVNVETNRTDNIFNPQKGILANITFLANVRKIISNDAVLSLEHSSGADIKSLYQKANDNPYQFQIHALGAWYFPIYRMLSGKAAYQGGYFFGKELFQNELFQVGGFQSLRGFDENGFYVNHYQIATLELHFNIGGNSYFYAFSDNAFLESKYSDFYQKYYPISLGVGAHLDNNAGIFKIALGVGKHSGQPFGFRNAKVHFGYAAYF